MTDLLIKDLWSPESLLEEIRENIKNGVEWYSYNGWRHPDFVIVLCMNCENVTSFKSSSASRKNMLMNRCHRCSNVPVKGGHFNYWYKDGTPIGHDIQMTPEQLKYTVPTLKKPTEMDENLKERAYIQSTFYKQKVIVNTPVIILKNGIRIANFSSPHPFNFVTGERLLACEDEWVNKMKLDIEEVEYFHGGSGIEWVDVELKISIPKHVREALYILMHYDDIDIILVPHMVLQAMKNHKGHGMVTDKCRVIRCADRITKEIYSDKFCI